MKNIRIGIIGIICFLSYAISFAENIEHTVKKYINNFTYFNDAYTFTWTDPDRAAILGGIANFKDIKTNNRLSIGFDFSKNICYQEYLRFDIEVEVNYFYIQNPTTTPLTTGTSSITKTLSIDIDPDNLMSYKELDILYLENVYQATIKLKSIKVFKSNGSEKTMANLPYDYPSDIFVEWLTQHERIRTLNYQTPASGIVVTDIPLEKKINVTWAHSIGAEYYDIEWLYVNNYSNATDLVTTTLPISQILVNFRNNSARVRIPAKTSGNFYRIPNVFDRGYIVFRVRAVGKGGADYDDEIPGKWSILDGNTSALLSALPSSCYYQNSNSTLPYVNWKGNISYAEDGKSKYVVSYADGSGRVRQAVTLSSTTNLAIITETIYDFQGRPAIQTLPVPTNSSMIQYYSNFNRSATTNQKYKASDFDLDPSTNACVNKPDLMSGVSGSEWYYSLNNTFSQKETLPKANGFPFSITQYERDNTGRVRREGGVGSYHTLGSAHETQYYYGTPPQELLDRLFGSDVGYSNFYKMNMVKDANGQISVSYLDMAGRTIATALAGDAPSNLENLLNEQNLPLDSISAELFNVDLLNKDINFTNGKNNILSDDKTQLNASAQILVTASGLNTFHYSLNKNGITDSCASACFDPVYDLEISLLDECSNNILNLPSNQTKFIYQIGNLPVDYICNETNIFNTDDAHLNVFTIPNMPTGAYSISKKLTINENAFDSYWNYYLENSSCLKSKADFFIMPDTSGCIYTCAQCEAEMASLGTRSAYIQANKNMYINQVEAEKVLGAIYDEKARSCDAICKVPVPDACSAGYQMMLLDMKPGGQYAQFSFDASTSSISVSANTNPLSIFLEPSNGDANKYLPYRMIGSNSMVPSWKNPYYENGNYQIYDYVDENDDIVWIPLFMDQFNNYTPEVDDINAIIIDPISFTALTKAKNIKHLSDFIHYYDQYPSFAKSLIFYHPEYYSYKWCQANTYNNVTFQGKNINTWQYDGSLSAMTAIDAKSEFGNSMNLISKDPFFISQGQNTLCGTSESYQANMLNRINNFKTINGTSFSIYQFAYIVNHCSSPANQTLSAINSCLSSLAATENKDYIVDQRVWETLVAFYLSAKQDVLNYAQFCYSNSAANNYNNTNCIASTNGSPNSTFASQNIYSPCNGHNYDLYINKDKRFPSQNQALDLLNNNSDSTYLQQFSDQQYYKATGICPVVRDLVSMLNTLTQRQHLLNAVVFNSGPYLTPLLYKELKSNNLSWNPSVTNNTKTISWTMNGYNCPFVINFPAHPDNLNFTNVLYFINPHSVSFATDSVSFLIDVQVLNPETNLNEIISITASACINVISCIDEFKTLCDVNPETRDLGNLLNYLIGSSVFNAVSPVALNSIPYPSLLTSRILSYIYPNGLYTWQFDNVNNKYKLSNTTNNRQLELSFISTGGVNVNIPFVILGYSPIDNTLPGLSNKKQVKLNVYQGSTPYNGLQASNFTMILEVNTINIPHPFNTVSCNYMASPECNNSANANREELERILRNYVGYTGVPDSACFSELKYNNSSLNVSFSNIQITGELIADMSKSSNMLTTNWFKLPIIRISPYGLDTLIGKYCQPIAPCNDCQQPCVQPDTIFATFSYPPVFPPNTQYTIFYLEGCLSMEHTYNNEPIDLYINSFVSKINNDPFYSNRIIASSNGLDLYIKFIIADGPLSSCPCSNGYKMKLELVEHPYKSTTLDSLDAVPCCKPFMAPISYVVSRPATSLLSSGPWEAPDSLTFPLDCSPFTAPFPEPPSLSNPCAQQLIEIAQLNAQQAYQLYLDSIKREFRYNYVSRAMNVQESFTRKYRESQYHYTLYYYDQGGNLVRTVPPKAVKPLPQSSLNAVKTSRSTKGTPVLPLHAQSGTPQFLLCSDYRFNSLDQPIVERSPDGGISKFWYDELGRIVFSQNSKQNTTKYSYTFYDAQGRITEVGQLSNSTSLTQTIASNISQRNTWLSSANTKIEVTRTFYDNQPFLSTGIIQQNLRNRVASVTYADVYNSNSSIYETATHYSYDIHGNVNRLWQENKNMPVNTQRIKQIQYYYDLVSGNVNGVAYQPGEIDAFYHKYQYDADNRLTNVFTIDGIHAPLLKQIASSWQKTQLPFFTQIAPWNNDASYVYYRHGPLQLARFNKNHVQYMSYIYTLQGWIKGVNTETLDPTKSYFTPILAANNFGRESFSYYLDYYQNDYEPIGGSFVQAYASRGALYTNNDIISLYNGNIAAMSTTIRNPNTMSAEPLLGSFRYDQLNRIKNGDYYKGLNVSTNAWTTTPTNDYKNSYKYDPNGNITHLMRNGTQSMGLAMDDLTYHYKPNTNQLAYISDAVTSSPYMDDLRNQNPGNYNYDAIGNLIQDNYEGITGINWTLYGKIKNINRTGGKSQLSYFYNPNGQRVQKNLIFTDSIASTYYVHDASGNMMASYKYGKKTSTGKDTLYTDEFIMYGSSRLGIKNVHHYNLKQASFIKNKIINEQSGLSMLGDKQYEFSDHLGNVHMTISDRNKKICSGTTWQYNNPDILTSTDYYPGGYQMPERKWNTSTSYTTPIIKEQIFDYEEDFASATKTSSNTTTWINNRWYNVPGYSNVTKSTVSNVARLTVTNTSSSCRGLVSTYFGVSPSDFYILYINIVAINGQLGDDPSVQIHWYERNPGEAEVYKGIAGSTNVSGNYSVSIYPTKTNVRFEIRLSRCHPGTTSGPLQTPPTSFSFTSISMSACSKTPPNMCYQNYSMPASSATLTTANDEVIANWKNEQPGSTLSLVTDGSTKKVQVSSTLNTQGIIYDHFNLIPGKEYTVQYDIEKGTASSIVLSAWQKNPSDAVYPVTPIVTQTQTTTNTYSFTFIPTKSQIKVQLRSSAAGQHFFLRDFSISHTDTVAGGGILVSDTARYQFGFNGQLKDNEIYGEGNAYAFEYRIQDPRLVRFLSVDPLRKDYPWYSPYQFAGNKTIWAIDREGAQEKCFNEDGVLINGIYPVVSIGIGRVSNFKDIINLQEDIMNALNTGQEVSVKFKDIDNEILKEKVRKQYGGVVQAEQDVCVQLQFNIQIVNGGDMKSASDMTITYDPDHNAIDLGALIMMGASDDFPNPNTPAKYSTSFQSIILNPAYFDSYNEKYKEGFYHQNQKTNTISHEIGHDIDLDHPVGVYPKDGLMGRAGPDINKPTGEELQQMYESTPKEKERR